MYHKFMIMSELIHVGLLIQTRLMSLIIGTSLCGTLEKPSEELIVSVSHDGQSICTQ